MSSRKDAAQTNPQTTSTNKGKRQRRPDSLNAKKLIDDAFARPVKIKYQGKFSTVSTFAAIIFQLTTKALTDRRALRVLGRYRAYAAANGGGRRVRLEYQPPDDSSEGS